ncbi:MAG: YigZ family protein [Lachnospiraceae bacterium]|nr:YigZ family protein [Lachnospiraceae bacterium]
MAENQVAEYRVLLEGGSGEIVEKKSRFIATVSKCETEEDANRFIAEIKKKYWDARHNCSAFVIGSRGELTRCSDDGEPSGTAGRPMLEVLLGEELRNVVVVVTRYFGGTLLGTGGLVRAYTQAVKEGLANCRMGRMRYGGQWEIGTDYNDIGKILHLLGQHGVEPLSSAYTEEVVLTLQLSEEQSESLCKELVDITNGRVQIEKKNECYFIEKA